MTKRQQKQMEHDLSMLRAVEGKEPVNRKERRALKKMGVRHG